MLSLMTALSACTSDATSDEQSGADSGDIEAAEDDADDERRLIARANHAEIAAADVVYVAAEGQWLCDVQTRAFTDLADLESARGVMLTNFEIEDIEYDGFKIRLGNDIELRDHVLAEFEAVCTG